MSQHWKSETDDDGIVWLCLDVADARANVLSSDVMRELDGVLRPLEQSAPAGLVVYSGKPGSFVMGADIKEFVGIDTAERAYDLVRQGQQLFDRLEHLTCPSVAVINGVCLGGGLELAMACDYRLALAGEKRILGLPEVKLGLNPGFGGTVRTVRICGVQAAMPLMLTGEPITAAKGRKIGLIDDISDKEHWRDAAKKLIFSKESKQSAPFIDRLLNLGVVRPLVRNMLLKQVQSKARKEHYPAPYAMIDLWSDEGASEKTGYEAEARSFAKLVCTSTSRNLVRVFFPAKPAERTRQQGRSENRARTRCGCGRHGR